MERKAYAMMMSWKEDPNRKALLVRGCRQTGKTHLVREFAEANYESHIYIDLEDRADIRAVFETEDISASAIIDRISFDEPVRLVPGRSAIILDEIQSCISAYSSLKSLVIDGRYDIIASGSLLGVKIDDLQRRTPMGYVNILDMGPMDFEEFLWAMGVKKSGTDMLHRCIDNKEHIDDYICKRTNDLFRRYMVVGGMPAAVLEYSVKQNYAAVRKILNDILEVVGEDAERYSKGSQRLRIESCLRSIPEQLADENDKFEYFRIEKRKGGARLYGTALLWLKRAGLIEYCYNLEEPVAPLTGRTRRSSFKLYMADTGMLTAMMEDGAAGNIVNRDPYSNNGAVMRNAIGCALRSNGYELRFYGKRDSTLEVDFVISIGGKVSAIEVKSGRDKRAKSLRSLSRTRSVSRLIKVSDGNVFVDENGIENYPLFGPSFFPRSDGSDIEEMGSMDDLNARFDEVRGDDAPSDRCHEDKVAGA
ncbi:ATP-binding protein [Candidatus Methanoprimaticola sp. MG2]|uniref:ATP-binding protein n=1 Tax=Candidatus Methanoprimaticola sp. MG2 TaxID=3228838 RepID=UPI0039C608A8